jgi:hypothetical protein
MDLGQECGDFRLSFQFTHDAGQRRPIVVDLRLFHPSLSIRIAKEGEHCIQRLVRILQNISKYSSLGVFCELLPRDLEASHLAPIDICKFCMYNIYTFKFRKYKVSPTAQNSQFTRPFAATARVTATRAPTEPNATST